MRYLAIATESMVVPASDSSTAYAESLGISKTSRMGGHDVMGWYIKRMLELILWLRDPEGVNSRLKMLVPECR